MNKNNISTILATKAKKMDTATKLANIKSIVKECRAAYGNKKVGKLQATINSCNGAIDPSFLTNEDKLALIAQEVQSIRTAAQEAVLCTTGTIFDKKVTELVALSPIMNRLTKPSKKSDII